MGVFTTAGDSYACSSINPIEEKIVTKSKKGKKGKQQSTAARPLATGDECFGVLPMVQHDQLPTPAGQGVPIPAVTMFPPGCIYTPTGIINHHLYCGLNALIQAFMVTPYLGLYLMTKESTEAARPNSRALRSFLTRIWNGGEQSRLDTDAIDPFNLEAAHCLLFSTRFKSDYQHDVLEYHGYLMDKLHEESKTSATGLSPTQHIFQGCYDNGDRFDTLLLGIKGEGIRSVSQALRAHLSDGGIASSRKFRELPPVLCIGLNRTEFNENTFLLERVNKTITYGPNIFIKQSMMETKGHPETRFSLYAVIKHVGNSATNGHYIAYVKNPLRGTWHWLNDHMLSTVQLTAVLSDSPNQSAFMLFYSRSNNDTVSTNGNGPKKTKKKKKCGA